MLLQNTTWWGKLPWSSSKVLHSLPQLFVDGSFDYRSLLICCCLSVSGIELPGAIYLIFRTTWNFPWRIRHHRMSTFLTKPESITLLYIIDMSVRTTLALTPMGISGWVWGKLKCRHEANQQPPYCQNTWGRLSVLNELIILLPKSGTQSMFVTTNNSIESSLA